MTERITISLSETGEFDIRLNEAGRDLLVAKLQKLSMDNDHFHLDPEGMIDVRVATTPYKAGDKVFEWGKVSLRPDEWDANFFPHVLNGTIKGSGV